MRGATGEQNMIGIGQTHRELGPRVKSKSNLNNYQYTSNCIPNKMIGEGEGRGGVGRTDVESGQKSDGKSIVVRLARTNDTVLSE